MYDMQHLLLGYHVNPPVCSVLAPLLGSYNAWFQVQQVHCWMCLYCAIGWAFGIPLSEYLRWPQMKPKSSSFLLDFFFQGRASNPWQLMMMILRHNLSSAQSKFQVMNCVGESKQCPREALACDARRMNHMFEAYHDFVCASWLSNCCSHMDIDLLMQVTSLVRSVWFCCSVSVWLSRSWCSTVLHMVLATPIDTAFEYIQLM